MNRNGKSPRRVSAICRSSPISTQRSDRLALLHVRGREQRESRTAPPSRPAKDQAHQPRSGLTPWPPSAQCGTGDCGASRAGREPVGDHDPARHAPSAPAQFGDEVSAWRACPHSVSQPLLLWLTASMVPSMPTSCRFGTEIPATSARSRAVFSHAMTFHSSAW